MKSTFRRLTAVLITLLMMLDIPLTAVTALADTVISGEVTAKVDMDSKATSTDSKNITLLLGEESSQRYPGTGSAYFISSITSSGTSGVVTYSASTGTKSITFTAAEQGTQTVTVTFKSGSNTHTRTFNFTVKYASATFKKSSSQSDGYTVYIETDGSNNLTLLTEQQANANGVTAPNGNQGLVGWKKGGSNPLLQPGITVTVNQGEKATFIASWAQKRTVSFNKNASDATGSVPSITAAAGTTITLPNGGFTRNGYTQVGWIDKDPNPDINYLNNAQYTVPNKNITLYADWKQNPVITYYANDGTTKTSMQSVAYGATATLSNAGNFSRQNHTLAGWATSKNGAVAYPVDGEIQNVTSNINLYAVWTPYPVITYHDGSANTHQQHVAPGTTATLSNAGNFSKDHHTLIGWATTSDGEKAYEVNGEIPNVTSDIDLYAVWQPVEYTVTYHPNGGTGTVAPTTGTWNTQVALASDGFTREHHQLAGWATSQSATAAEYALGQTITLTGDMTLYAVWNAYPKATFHQFSEPATVVYATDRDGTITDVPGAQTLAGHTFKFWTDERPTSGNAWRLTQGELDNLTLPEFGGNTIADGDEFYPVYTTTKYTVTFYIPNTLGGMSVYEQQTVLYGDPAQAPEDPDLSELGLHFTGWDEDFSEVTEDLLVYAQYVEFYTVTFYDKDGNVIGEPQQVDVGQAATAPTESEMAIPGFRFLGWDTDAYQNVTQDLEVHALYVAQYTVTFYDKDGKVIDVPRLVDENGEANPPTPPTYPNFKFARWSTDAYLKVTRDLDVYAEYELNRPWKVEFYKTTTSGMNVTVGARLGEMTTDLQGYLELPGLVETGKWTWTLPNGQVFGGWSENPTSSSNRQTHLVGENMLFTGDAKLYGIPVSEASGLDHIDVRLSGGSLLIERKVNGEVVSRRTVSITVKKARVRYSYTDWRGSHTYDETKDRSQDGEIRFTGLSGLTINTNLLIQVWYQIEGDPTIYTHTIERVPPAMMRAANAECPNHSGLDFIIRTGETIDIATHTVTFKYKDNGRTPDWVISNILSGTSIPSSQMPQTPTDWTEDKDGYRYTYTFDTDKGWTPLEDYGSSSLSNVTRDMVYEANYIWTRKKLAYMVTYETSGAPNNPVPAEPTEYGVGVTVEVLEPVPVTGYNFTGWTYTDEDEDNVDPTSPLSGGATFTMPSGNVKLTGVYTPITRTISGKKTWHDGTGENRPDSLTVYLKNGEDLVASTTTSKDKDWEYKFEDVREYDENGKKIDYTVDEELPTGYEKSVNGFDLTNTKLTSFTVVKEWLDGKATDRPQSVTVTLSASDGHTIPDAQQTLVEATEWTYTWEGLPQYTADDELITYTVTESEVDGYASSIEPNEGGATITNTKMTDITVTKIWDDGDAFYRPRTLTLDILKNGEYYDSVTIDGPRSSESWSHTFEDLPEYDEDGKITYTVYEPNVPGGTRYVAAYDGLTVTNTSYVTITFVDWDNTILKQVKVKHGGSTTAPVVTSDRPNYVFVGWDKPASTWEKNVTRDITIYAEYEMLEQAVTEITELGIPLAGGTVTNVGDSFD